MKVVAAAVLSGGMYAVWPGLLLPASAAPTSLSAAAASRPPAAAVAAPVVRAADDPSATPATKPLVERSAEPMSERHYACRKLGDAASQYNTCRVRASEVVGSERTLGDGSSAQSRANGTFMSRAELAELGARYLQVGGDWWNKCGDGWVNGDSIFTRLPIGFVCEDWRTGRHIVRLDAGKPLPFEDGAFDAVYTEHMFEHMLPQAGATFLREAYRVVRPGGVIRVTTPDLEKYLNGYVNRRTDPFLKDHADRWPPMGKLGLPHTAATVVNNIFRNYEHRWIYDFEEVVRTAHVAGIPVDAVHRSSRLGADLPPELLRAIRAAETPSTAKHQASRSENPTRCWLEQDIREQESLYVLIRKPAA